MLDTISREGEVFDWDVILYSYSQCAFKKGICDFRTSFDVLRVIINTSE